MAIYAIGDIHGKLSCLESIRQKILVDSKQYSNNKIIYLGDYIDRGPDSYGVIETFIKNPMHGFKEIFLKGNHEESITDILDDKSDWDRVCAWLYHGGYNTLQSYRVDVLKLIGPFEQVSKEFNNFNLNLFGLKTKIMPIIKDIIVSHFPPHHIDFFKYKLKTLHKEQGYFFVHAGIDPDMDIDDQTEEQFFWIRQDFLQSDKNFGFKVVHGHTPGPIPVNRHNRIGIDTGAYGNGILTAVALADGKEYFLQTS
jgi:serine/threonine protein phosphatase 1